MSLNNLVKRLQDIMRNDAGINGDAQRIEQMVWILFLKVYDAKEEIWEFYDENYTSIIHGKAYATAQKEYQITNNEAGAYYYPDFGKEVAVYPSIFEALGQSFPNRGNAAFALSLIHI